MPRRERLWIGLVIWLVLGTTALDTVVQITANLGRVGDIGYPDSAMIYVFRQAAESGKVFQPYVNEPYLANVYGPLFYDLMSIPFSLTSGDSPHLLLRGIELGFALACLILVGRLAFLLSGAPLVAVCAFLLAMSLNLVAGLALVLRADFMGIAISLLSISLWGKSASRIYASGAIAGTAALFKITFVSLPLAIGLHLLLNKRFLDMARFSTAWLAVFLSGYGYYTWREPELLAHLGIFSPPLLQWGIGSLILPALQQPVVYLAIGGLLVARRDVIIKGHPLATYGLVAWIVACVTILQVGANLNYFLEPLLIAAVFAGIALGNLLRDNEHLSMWSRAIIAAVLFFQTVPASAKSILGAAKSSYLTGPEERLAPALRGRSVLSFCPFLTLSAGRPVLLDPFTYSLMVVQKKLDSEPLLRRIRNREFEVVVLQWTDNVSYRGIPIMSPQLTRGIYRSYEHFCSFEPWRMFLRPGSEKSELAIRLVEAGCRPAASEKHFPDELAKSAATN